MSYDDPCDRDPDEDALLEHLYGGGSTEEYFEQLGYEQHEEPPRLYEVTKAGDRVRKFTKE